MPLNNKKFFDLTYIIFTLSLFLVSKNLPDLNIFFWIILYVFALALYVKDFKVNFIILFLLLCASLYIQLYFFEFVLAKEFFVKVIGILLIFRFLNIKTKSHLFSFNVICLYLLNAIIDIFATQLESLLQFSIFISMHDSHVGRSHLSVSLCNFVHIQRLVNSVCIFGFYYGCIV